MTPAIIRSCGVLSATFAAVFLQMTPCQAADASPWDGDSHAAARLIAASIPGPSQSARAGIEIKLAPGWKTYWRYPGDSGVPPRFDFSASENVKAVTALWPAPQLFNDAEGKTIGYKNRVIFPLRVEAADPAKPVTLVLKLDYAVCEKLCVPVEAKSELTLASGPSGNDAEIAAAEKQVPKKIAPGETSDISVRHVAQDAQSTPPRILVDVAAPAGAPLSIFAEGPNADWALPIPEKVAGAPAGLQRFSFALDGVPPGADAKGAVGTLTIVSGDRAIETQIHLD